MASEKKVIGKVRTVSGERQPLNLILKRIQSRKPSTVFQEDVNTHKEIFTQSEQDMKDKVDFFYKNYGVLRTDERGRKTFYSAVTTDYLRFANTKSFWHDLTSMITQDNPKSLSTFISHVEQTAKLAEPI